MILSTLKLRFAQNKWLLIAAFISMALHILLLTSYSISLPSDIKNLTSINVRLVKALPEKRPIKPYVPQERPNPITQKSTAPDTDEPTLDSEVPTSVLNTAPPNTNQLDSDNQTNTESDSRPQSEGLIAESAIENTTITETASSVNTDITTAYPYVHTEFEVRRGDDSGILGITQITFYMNQRNGTYQLTSVTDAKGIASLFLKRLEQRSEGNVDEKGLKPNYYAYEYGGNSEKNQYANLLWSDGVIEMTSKKGKKSEPLPEGTQDFLSFMYQFMFTPPLNSMQITMTNGKYLRTYTYSFEGEETVATKLGDLKTLHLLKSGDNLEKTEIWLALDYQNIPVKVRKTEKNGEVLEQTVTAISTTRPE
ncbi:DUF3108 domain-containing protein [Methylotenera sp.]|uniref:DUF3108 domain-containing protein n=1 Tax=Methylotenera sp. TaxID=2051956 RepID=UPI0027375BD2|nr:DUF3108 domain-containing protein [Methylotenera sp.]MDP3210024.1 DUF3108 domain-containing protein [Methylotenera sp.]